jgi:hypothetical protein
MSSLRSHLTHVSLCMQCFQGAALRWQSIITAEAQDFGAQTFDWINGSFLPEYPGYFDAVDDIVIVYRITPIDGPGKILGRAGPEYIRIPIGQPISAIMEFDFCTYAILRGATCVYNVYLL